MADDIVCPKVGSRWSHIYALMYTKISVQKLHVQCSCGGNPQPMFESESWF